MATSAFREAVSSGDLERLLALVAQNPGLINEPHPGGHTTLCVAAGNGQDVIVRVLLAAGARQDVPGQAVPPLVAAALNGHDSTLGLLLGAGGDVNATNAHGTTALHAAAAGGHKGCVQWLLAAGAAADPRNRDGATPLAHAAFHGQTACVQQLLAAGADVSGADNDSDTPLLWAASHNEQPDTVALLLGAGASVAETNRFGETALHLAAKKGLTAVLRTLVESPGVLPVLQARCCKGLTPRQSGTRQAAQFLERLELRLKAQQARQARQKQQQAAAQADDTAAAAAAEAAAAELLAEEEGEAVAGAAKQKQQAKLAQRQRRERKHQAAAAAAAALKAEEEVRAGAAARAPAKAACRQWERESTAAAGVDAAQGVHVASQAKTAGGKETDTAACKAASPAGHAQPRPAGEVQAAIGQEAPATPQKLVGASAQAAASGSGAVPAIQLASPGTPAATPLEAAAAAGFPASSGTRGCGSGSNTGSGVGSPADEQEVQLLMQHLGLAEPAAASQARALSPPDKAVHKPGSSSSSSSSASSSTGRFDSLSIQLQQSKLMHSAAAGPTLETAVAAGAGGLAPRSQAAVVGLLPPALLSELLCPICCEAMQDPVVAADGVTYERVAITAWIERQLAAGQAPTSPLTGAPLDHASLCPNRIARGLAACLLAAGVRLD
ncbi:hypothetical protein ABPG77_001758 [Micractinium sp. CCAP 211/92]